MKAVIGGLALGLMGAACVAQNSAPELPQFKCDRSPLVIRNVEVFGSAHSARGNDVLIVDGLIQELQTARLKIPQGARVVDARGQVMIPGFVDAHVHFVFPGNMGDRKTDPVADALVFGRQLLAGGVTSARVHLDTLEHGQLLLALSKDECAPMPRLQAGGPGFIPGTGDRDTAPVWDVTSVEDARAKVRREHDAGFQWIAIHDAQKFPDDARAAIVATARQLGLRILGSGWTPPEVASSLALHPDTLDYLEITPAPGYDAATLKEISSQPQLTWVARLGIHERFRAYQEDPALIDDPENFEFYDAATAAAVRTAVHQAVADRDSEHSKRMDGAYPTMARKFEQAIKSGASLAMGTDVGSPGQFHRNAMAWEINAWVNHGVALTDALRYASGGGARALQDSTIGKLAVNSRADFLLCPREIWSRKPVSFKGCSVYRGGVSAPASAAHRPR